MQWPQLSTAPAHSITLFQDAASWADSFNDADALVAKNHVGMFLHA
jgi:hypothetical protein